MVQRIAFLLFFSLSWHSISGAQIFAGAVSHSTGGTGRASVDPGTATFLNPASMVHQTGEQIYTASAGGEIVVGLAENTNDSAIPMAITYWQKTQELSGDNSIYRLQDIRLSFAEFVKSVWAVGITGHYYQVRADLADQTSETWNQAKFDLGLMVTPISEIGLALVFYDLGPSNSQIPEALRLTPKIGFGFNHLYRSFFRSRVDLLSGPEHNFGKSTVMIGCESYLNRWILGRFGMSSNTFLKEDITSLGMGLDFPLFRLNYGVQFVATGSGEQARDQAGEQTREQTREQRHAVDLVVPF